MATTSTATMPRLNSPHQEPPDGWKYLQRESQIWIRGEFLSDLVELVVSHRIHKNLSPVDRESVEKEIVTQICLGAQAGTCQGERGEVYSPFNDMSRSLTLSKVESVARAGLAWLAEGMKPVTKSESERRADICRGCPFNKAMPACACTPFYKMIDALVPSGRSEPGLFICMLCGCSLKAKVLVPDEVVREGNPENLRLPDYCWQK